MSQNKKKTYSPFFLFMFSIPLSMRDSVFIMVKIAASMNNVLTMYVSSINCGEELNPAIKYHNLSSALVSSSSLSDNSSLSGTYKFRL